VTVPAVTICIPTYNYARFLPFAIESVLSQSFTDFELLVLDNASTDNTSEAVARFTDSRLQYRRNSENLGFVGNVNSGLRHARGRFIGYLCADDVWPRQSLEERVRALDDDPSVGLVHSAEEWIDAEGRLIGANRANYSARATGQVALREFLTRGWNLSFSSCLLRTDLLRNCGGFRPQFGYIADSGMFIEMCKSGNVVYLDDYLVGYRFHGKSLTNEILNGGQIFRDQHRLLLAVFGEAAAANGDLGITYDSATKSLAFDVARVSHISRMEGRRKQVLDDFRFAFQLYPGIVWSPEVVARLAISLLLPVSSLRLLQALKRAAAKGKRA
jgi:glycosyltransferase involved in cell wall biosynthesis